MSKVRRTPKRARPPAPDQFPLMGVAQPPRTTLRDAMLGGDEGSPQDTKRVAARLRLLERATTAEELAKDVHLTTQQVERLTSLFERPAASWRWAKANGWELAEGGLVVHMLRKVNHEETLFQAGDKRPRERRR